MDYKESTKTILLNSSIIHNPSITLRSGRVAEAFLRLLTQTPTSRNFFLLLLLLINLF